MLDKNYDATEANLCASFVADELAIALLALDDLKTEAAETGVVNTFDKTLAQRKVVTLRKLLRIVLQHKADAEEQQRGRFKSLFSSSPEDFPIFKRGAESQ